MNLLISCILSLFFPLMWSQSWDKSLNTAENEPYLSEIEKEVIWELNKVRNNPARYAKEYLYPLRSSFEGKKFTYHDQLPIITSEGKKALEECISVLLKTQSSAPLKSSNGLWKAAKLHCKDQSKSGKVGHIGKDGLDFAGRIEKFGQWKQSAAENISYGNTEARQIVISLLVDDGIKSRGHRINILNPEFKLVGVSCSNHPNYEFMCVMDFAGGFTPNL